MLTADPTRQILDTDIMLQNTWKLDMLKKTPRAMNYYLWG